MIFEHLHKWQNNTHEGSQRTTRQLPERGDQQHADMAPAQRHTLHIDHLAIFATSQMQQSQTQSVPLFYKPTQQQANAHTHGRLKETQGAVDGGI